MILDCEECTASLCSSREKLCIFGLESKNKKAETQHGSYGSYEIYHLS